MPRAHPLPTPRSPRVPFRAPVRERDWPDRLAGVGLAVGAPIAVVGLLVLGFEGTENLFGFVAITLLGAAATVLLFRALVEPADRTLLRNVVIGGVLLRLGLVLIFHHLLPVGFFAPDEFTYQDAGWRTLQFLQGEGPRPRQIADTFEAGYFFWNAFLYWVFGFLPLMPKLVNAFLGAWTGMLAYRTAGELAGRGSARIGAILGTFFPSLVLWSTQNLRDTAVVMMLAAVMLLAIRLRKRWSTPTLVALVSSLLVLGVLRDYMAVMAVFALMGSFLITPARSLSTNLVLGLILIAVSLISYDQLGLGSRWVESASFEFVDEQRRGLAAGQTAFAPDADVSDPVQSLRFLPFGLGFFLFAPFPWQIRSVLSVMTLPEMVLWYGLMLVIPTGAWYLLRRQFQGVAAILLFLVITVSIYALVEGNAGTAYRHRSQVIIFFLILASVGLALRKARRDPGRPAGAHPPGRPPVLAARAREGGRDRSPPGEGRPVHG